VNLLLQVITLFIIEDWDRTQKIKPNDSYLKMLNNLHKRAIGELTYVEFGKKFRMVESKSTQMMYMGHAVKSFPL
jgi:hypothetical protein